MYFWMFHFMKTSLAGTKTRTGHEALNPHHNSVMLLGLFSMISSDAEHRTLNSLPHLSDLWFFFFTSKWSTAHLSTTTVYPSFCCFQQDNVLGHKGHLRLASWTWQWGRCTQTALKSPDLFPMRQQSCIIVATVWWCHINMDQNQWETSHWKVHGKNEWETPVRTGALKQAGWCWALFVTNYVETFLFTC